MAGEMDVSTLCSDIICTTARLLDTVTPSPRCLVVGFSGGVDSGLLLHALSSYSSLPVHGVYIHHGLSPNADTWQNHCETFCHQRNVIFSALSVNVTVQSRTSLEASARDARYDALLRYCRQHNGALVLGQHQDDQLETLLLAVKRGSGPAGLAGMSGLHYRQVSESESPVAVLRPLLNFRREDIELAAGSLAMPRVEDESNQDNRFDRNFLRNHVLPDMHRRWPGFAKAASRSCELLQEQNALLAEVTVERLKDAETGNGGLSVPALLLQSSGWQRAIIRHWLTGRGVTLPSKAQMDEVLAMLHARDDAMPCVKAGAGVIRRYNSELLFTADSGSCTDDMMQESGDPQPVDVEQWQQVPGLPVTFKISGPGDWQRVPAVSLDKIYVSRNPTGKTARKWFKQWKIPPWERERIPVLLCNGEAAALLLTDRVVWLAAGNQDLNRIMYKSSGE